MRKSVYAYIYTGSLDIDAPIFPQVTEKHSSNTFIMMTSNHADSQKQNCIMTKSPDIQQQQTQTN